MISVRFIDKNLVKMSLIGQFGQNRSFFVKMVQIGSFLHNLGAKMPSYVKILVKWSNFRPITLEPVPLKILTYYGILAPKVCKNDPIWTIFTKNALF